MKNPSRLFSLFLSIYFLLTPLSFVVAESAIEDQFCDDASITAAEDWWLIKAHDSLSQTFLPKKTKLNSIMVALAGGGDVNAPVKMDLYQIGGGLVTSKTETTQSALVSWVEFNFPTVSIDITKQYKITLTSPSNTVHWVISKNSCYEGGNAIVDTTNYPTQDFGFVTYGYDPATPTPTPTVTVEVSPTATPTPTPSPTLTPTIMEEVTMTPTNKVEEESDQNALFILGAIIWALLIGGVVMYIIIKERKKVEEQINAAKEDENKDKDVKVKEAEVAEKKIE